MNMRKIDDEVKIVLISCIWSKDSQCRFAWSNRGLIFIKKVFKHSYIPYTMDEVVDFERDFRRAKQGDKLIYTTFMGIKEDLSQPRLVPDHIG